MGRSYEEPLRRFAPPPHEWGGVMKSPSGASRHLPMNGEELAVRTWELDRTPDLVDLVSGARDAGHEVMLIERPMPDAVSVAAIGRSLDIVAAPNGVAVEDAEGRSIDFEAGEDRILAASRAWQRHAPEDAIAVGGFAYRPDREPGGAWSGFPALLFRIPALTVMRRRGRTFVTAAAPGAEDLLELTTTTMRAPAAHRLDVTPLRNPLAWADGSAFAGASPELLIRRLGRHAFSQPMAGSVARGASDAEDERLAKELTTSEKDGVEHRLVSKFVVEALKPHATRVEAHDPEVVRFTNIQHLATSVTAELKTPSADVLSLAAALHPTPAVGGWPRQAADRLIDELEAMERGWYAGAVGWIDGRGDGELAVALRCGLLWEDGARLYAGVGVMPDSDPARELEETELKFNALLTALI